MTNTERTIYGELFKAEQTIADLERTFERIDLCADHRAALTDADWQRIHALVQDILMSAPTPADFGQRGLFDGSAS